MLHRLQSGHGDSVTIYPGNATQNYRRVQMTKSGSRGHEPNFQTPKNLDELKARWLNGEVFSLYFFYGHEQHGDAIDSSCLSQWFRREFVIDGISYPTAEHWMMAEKARTFNDPEALGRILTCYSPKEAKALGRSVRNFDEEVWNRIRLDIVERGNEAKFSQNQELKEFLISTADSAKEEYSMPPKEPYGMVAEKTPEYWIGSRNGAEASEAPEALETQEETISIPINRPKASSQSILVEAAGRDRIWGIGLGKNNPKSTNPLTWRGLNLLGFALTSVRERIQR
jgi:ribA/ribD-fused uncharacterized protein